MIRVPSPDFDGLDTRIAHLAELITSEATDVMERVAQEVGAVRTAAGKPPPNRLPEQQPPEPVPPPGEPAVSLDTLAIIATLWGTAVAAQLLPYVADTFTHSAQEMRDGIVSQRPDIALPEDVGDAVRTLAQEYLATAENRMRNFSDELWSQARAQLLEGFIEGESIDKLRDRLRQVAGLSAARARTVARTEVISASNAGSLSMVEVAGFAGTKSWLATEDMRTRPTHMLADGQTVPIEGMFIVGGFPLAFPGDPAGPPEEILNCRCTTTFNLDDEPLTAAGGTGMAGEWIGVLTLEGSATGDGRMFAPNALTWADLPMPLLWQRQTGDGHDGSVIVGDIRSIARAGNQIVGSGTFDLSTPEGAEAYQRVGSGYLKGVSVDADNFTADSVEYLYGEDVGGEPSISMVIFHAARIRGATLCALPAFAEAFVQLMPEMEPVMEDSMEVASAQVPLTINGEPSEKMATVSGDGVTVADGRVTAGPGIITVGWPAAGKATTVTLSAPATITSVSADSAVVATGALPAFVGALPEVTTYSTDSVPLTESTLQAAAYVLTIPDVPPITWFEEPTDVDIHGALTVTDEGRIYGYLAPAGVAHRSFSERVTVPMGNVDYSLFMGRETLTAAGGRVVTGALTMDCGHASTGFRDPVAAMDHYDNACSIVATVRIGENRSGVWVAGALVPGLSANQVSRVMACQLSGDWRPHRERPGWREFAGALLVPVPGFAMARSEASVRVSEGQLVASAVPVQFSATKTTCRCKIPAAPDMSSDLETLAASVGLDLVSRMDTLRRAVHRLEA